MSKQQFDSPMHGVLQRLDVLGQQATQQLRATHSYPPCFASAQQWQQWLAAARCCGESCSPCTDCTHAFAQQMRDQGRCGAKWVQVDFVVRQGRGNTCAGMSSMR